MTIYQVDCSVASSGKMVSMTKRRITWKWGVANEDAMEAGKVGVDCRGYEHEVTLVWSIASGKRTITEDGKTLHSSQGRRGEAKFHHSWVGFNNHVFMVIAHASLPLKANPKFRQFELFIDGQGLQSFPRIFELAKGVSVSRYSYTKAEVSSTRSGSGYAGIPESVSAPRSGYREYRSDQESARCMSGEDMQWARNASTRTSERSSSNRRSMYRAGSDNVTTTATKVPLPEQPQDLLSSPPVSLLDVEYTTSGSTSFWESENSLPSPLSQQSVYGYNPAQPPSFEQVHSSIMGAYDTNTHANIITTMPDMNKLNIYTDYPSENMKESLSVESPRDVADINCVLQNLVNMDDIASPVYQKYSQEETEKLAKMERSKKSLSELKGNNGGSVSAGSRPTKEIMKTHEEYTSANPGALVVYGQEQQSLNGYNHAHTYTSPPVYYGY